MRYSENPFIEDMIVPIRDQQVKLSRLGKDDNILINQSTGEERGTHVTTYRKVDADKFVKLFAANIAMTFDLNAAGIKVFNVLIWIVQNKAIVKICCRWFNIHWMNLFHITKTEITNKIKLHGF